ncbi:MAG: DUF1501 domain-containing protein, partial [Gemmataceae bacterium]|nr:DUF1501 domain-containing protein [Gemmataceae bacterium]
KKPHFPAKAASVICVFNYGGVSQVDTFDPKPELTRRSGQEMPKLDAELKGRAPGTLLGTKRAFKKHGKSGIEVSDLFPHVARHADKLCVIRSNWTNSFAHGSGLLQMNTGFVRQGHPCLGSWVTYGLGSVSRDLPGFVVMLDRRGGPIGGAPNWGHGYMPAAYQGTQMRTQGDPILHLSPAKGTTAALQRRELDLLGELDRAHAKATPDNSELDARLASYELAFRMQSRAPEAVDLGKESTLTRALYGMDEERTSHFGKRLLLARRLVERGVRFVQVYSGGGHSDQNWDAHGDVETNHKLHAGETDKPLAGLLADLEARGLLDSTLVIWTSEFGRTPTGQNGKGRDHSPKGFTTWLCGAGVKPGTVVGATDEFGYAAVENRVHVRDLHATILHLLGFDHTKLTFFHGGRQQRLTDVGGNVVEECLA